jgi:hypothetical protein
LLRGCPIEDSEADFQATVILMRPINDDDAAAVRGGGFYQGLQDSGSDDGGAAIFITCPPLRGAARF